MVVARRVALLALTACLLASPLTASAAPPNATCSFKLGFKVVADLMPEIVGECRDDERFDPATGNTLQATTNGLLVWRKADNWTAFTDGVTTWINGPYGIEARENTVRFAWEADAVTLPLRDMTPGTVLLSDSFDDAESGVLPRVSGNPEDFSLDYADGEYVIRKLNPRDNRLPTATLPGAHEDTTLAIDVRLVGATADQYAALICRSQFSDPPEGETFQQSSEYRLVVLPTIGEFALTRYDASRQINLVSWQETLAINPGDQTNHVELTCAGNTISASINGVEVASVEDATYRAGAMLIGVGVLNAADVTAEARFDNLQVVQR
jgi:hypothetical protein